MEACDSWPETEKLLSVFVWRWFGQAWGSRNPFIPNQALCLTFDKSMPVPDSYLNWIVLALLEAQWLVSLSPHRPPLAWWSPTTLWRCKLLLTVCLRCTQSWPDGGELFWPAAITLALQSSNYSLGIWVAGDVHSPSTACKARGECEICMKWQLKSSLTDPSTCAVWGGVFQDHTQPLVCAWFFLSVREENT